MNNDENKITNEKENEEINLTDKDIKDNSNNRLNILFKFLWFFSAVFLFGIHLMKNTPANNPTESIDLLPAFIFGSSLFMMYSIVIYILKEMPIFFTKIDEKIKNTAEQGYQTVINNIQMIIIGAFLYLIVSPIILKYINIYIYNMSFIGVMGIIVALIGVATYLDREKCHIFLEERNISIPSTTWAQITNLLMYLLCLTLGISYQILTVAPTLTSAII